MHQISDLISSSLSASKNLRTDLFVLLAQKWPHEFRRLCQPMKESPSTLHGLVNITEDELPSGILLKNNLLLKQDYDAKNYVELNRGMSSTIALLYILRGDCYEPFIEGQKKEIRLPENSYVNLHNECKNVLMTNAVWNEPLLDMLFYAVLFNDLGKNLELKKLLRDQYQVKENDHDLLLVRAFEIKGLLQDFSTFNALQQNCLRAMWHGGFNPSSFDTLEYPITMIINWVISFSDLAKENSQLYLAMKKIEILTDIAGVSGNNSKGATNLTEPVLEKFNKSFDILSHLISTHQQIEQKDSVSIYQVIFEKLTQYMQEQAQLLGLTTSVDLTADTVLSLRICKMIGMRDQSQAAMVKSVLKKIQIENSADYLRLKQEFFWTHDQDKPLLWMECIPKFLWLMSNGNNFDLLDKHTSKNSLERKENGLLSALLITSQILKKIRTDNHYEELYAVAGQPSVALFVAYDLVRIAQQASEVNQDHSLKEDAIERLKDLWNNGVMLNGRLINLNRAASGISSGKLPGFFKSRSESSGSSLEKHSGLATKLSDETNAHCAYLSSIGLADRAQYFKVIPFTYRDFDPKAIDVSRFSCTMMLPDEVKTFDVNEPNTLLIDSGSKLNNQDELNRVLNIRLSPSIRRMMTEQGARVFLGSLLELQAYTHTLNEKIILQLEVASSVKFFISVNDKNQAQLYISNIVSHENLIQQLITLKLASIDIQRLPIMGDTQYFRRVCQNDLLAFEKKSEPYIAKKNVLIVAGCSLEEIAYSTLEQLFMGKITKLTFSGDIVSIIYAQSSHAPDLGFLILNLNYGEICEAQISMILEKFNCIGIFSGSAAGFIPQEGSNAMPQIGDRITINSARHHSGELVSLNNKSESLHLQIPTIFFETFNWLEQANGLKACTVDVETFYILKAVDTHVKNNKQAKIHTDIGVFISDYVGIKPLRTYKEVFAKYPVALQNFVNQVLVFNLTSPYNNNRTSIPAFDNSYFSLTPKKISIDESMRKEAVVDSIGKQWDKTEFSKRVHTPVVVGKIQDQDTFSKKIVPRCLHLPIQFPGSDIRVPTEYQHFAEALQQILDFEASVNPHWNEQYAYLTVDQGFVPRSNTQRVPGPHVDGIPRDRSHPEAQLIDHAYLVANAIPTMFYLQQFDMRPYNPNEHHFFAIFRALSDESRTITTKPFEINLMDAYSVHTPTQSQEDVTRTFIRLEFSTLHFDRVGNSVNPHFPTSKDYPFTYVPRPIPKHLFVPPDVYLNKPITNEDFTHTSINQLGRMNLRAFFTQDDRYKLKRTEYRDLDLIIREIMNENNHGIVISHQGIPQGFCLYQIEDKTIKLDTLLTFMGAKGQEFMVYAMNILQQQSDRLALQAGLKEGERPISIVVNHNNEPMLPYFLRAARLAKIEVQIERQEQNDIHEQRFQRVGV